MNYTVTKIKLGDGKIKQHTDCCVLFGHGVILGFEKIKIKNCSVVIYSI
jgi:hypothetical protein